MAYSTRAMQPEDWKLLKRFKPTEFKYPDKMGFQFMLKLERMAVEAGVPCPVSSDHRPKAYNKKVGGAANSAHVDGSESGEFCEAVDINPFNSLDRYEIVRAAFLVGFERIGIYGNGSLHVDTTGHRRPNRVLWNVVSNPA